MKNFPLIFVCVIVMVIPLGLFVKSAMALERTINIQGVNYVSLTQMSKKYNLAIEEKSDAVVLTGEAINLIINKNSNLFSLNGNSYTAQELPQLREGMTWITAKDWASLFNLSLTNYDKVSQMEPVTAKPVSTDAVLDYNTYTVGADWGESVPESVRKHGNVTTIDTAHIDLPVYDEKHYNKLKQQDLQGR